MVTTDVELQLTQQLKEAGKLLSNPPASVDELLNVLDGVLPIARKLGEEVLQKSAAKLRPYLIQALSILGDSLDNYSQVLASICEGKTDVVEHKDDDLVQQQTDESKLVEESSNKTPQTCTSLSMYLSRDDGPSMDVVLTKAPEGLSDSDMKSPKRRRKKAPIAQEDKHPATVATVDDGKATSGPEPELLKMSSKKADTKPLKRSGKKVAAGDSVAKKPKMSGKKIDVGELEAKKPKQAGSNMDAGDAEGKPSRPSLNKEDVAKPLRQPANNGEKRRVITKPGTDSANKESSDSDDKPLQLSGKKGNTSSSTLVKYSSKSKDGKKQGRGKNEKDEEKSLPDEDGMDVSLKSALRAARREGNLEEARVTTSKRKRPIGKDKVTENIMYDDSLVGLKVKVYWPMDEMYYEGVIESFDSNENKHKVLYLDGEHEILNLRKQRWEILQEFSAPVEEKAAEVQSIDGSPEIPKKKSKISKVLKLLREYEIGGVIVFNKRC